MHRSKKIISNWPVQYTTLADRLGMKISRPMIHILTWIQGHWLVKADKIIAHIQTGQGKIIIGDWQVQCTLANRLRLKWCRPIYISASIWGQQLVLADLYGGALLNNCSHPQIQADCSCTKRKKIIGSVGHDGIASIRRPLKNDSLSNSNFIINPKTLHKA